MPTRNRLTRKLPARGPRSALRPLRAFLLGLGAAYLLGRTRTAIGERAHGQPPPETGDDEALARQIRHEVLPRLGLSERQVRVEVEGGVATVRGSVASASLADGLVEDVGRVRGVREVAAMIRVTPAARAA